jgi:hypothetical protein
LPEYVAPGVYTEEVSFRSRSVPGVPTNPCGALALGFLIGVGLAVFIDQIIRSRCVSSFRRPAD